jgi:hypothetical protein
MANSTANFSLTSNFNPNFDITWSFQYSITGITGSSGGFSTFLFNNTTLSGGGILSGLGFAPYTGYSGVDNAVLGIMFSSDNKITIKKGTNFTTLTTFNLPSLLYPLVKTTENFNTIRFNLTDVGQTLKIDIKDLKNNYINIASIPTTIIPSDNIFYKIGFSYSSPLFFGDDKIVLKFKDIHVQGQSGPISFALNTKPLTVPKEETFYIIQSPTSAYVDIGIPDPIVTGSLLHKS